MDKIAQFLEHARACMDLAAHAPQAQSEALLRIAEAWTALAGERRRTLGVRDDPAEDHVDNPTTDMPAPLPQTPADNGASRAR